MGGLRIYAHPPWRLIKLYRALQAPRNIKKVQASPPLLHQMEWIWGSATCNIIRSGIESLTLRSAPKLVISPPEKNSPFLDLFTEIWCKQNVFWIFFLKKSYCFGVSWNYFSKFFLGPGCAMDKHEKKVTISKSSSCCSSRRDITYTTRASHEIFLFVFFCERTKSQKCEIFA